MLEQDNSENNIKVFIQKHIIWEGVSDIDNEAINICSRAVKKYDFERAWKYYETNYDILVGQNTNFDHEEYLGNCEKKVCRFCGRDESKVSFGDKPHVFPICTGNVNLLSYYECDECNHFFGDRLEGEYQNYFSFVHNLYMVEGRKGKIPLVQSNDNLSKIKVVKKENDEKIHLINDIVDNEHVKIENNSIILSSPKTTIIPIAIYKCLTKMALSIMPEEELPQFQETLVWIKKKKHESIMKKKHMCRYLEFKHSPYVKYPMGFLFKRKQNSKDGPYMIFLYVYAKMAIMIEVPCVSMPYAYDIRKVLPLVCGIPIEDIIIDLSCTNKCLVEGWERRFQYGYINNLTEEARNPNSENEYAKLIRKNITTLK